MTFLVQDLGSEILWSAAEGEGLGIVRENLGETEICQANVAVLVHEDVLRLQVTIDDVLFVQMANSNGDLGSVELGTFFGETGRISQMHEQFSSSNETHDEEYLRLSLEDVVHSNEKRMIRLHKDLLLELCALHLIVVQDHILTE